MPRRCKSKICLVGKTVIVTGANTGIGYETALDLAARGARVILACRNESKAAAARDQIIEETGNQHVVVKILDLASFASVRNFAQDINETEERLNILVNNAGIGGNFGDGRTEDGFLTLMQSNYYSPFLLTLLLTDLLKRSQPSRVVNVSSVGAKFAKLTLDKIDDFPGSFTNYCNSKLCNILFTRVLAEKLNGTGVTTYSVHPGGVKTEIFRHETGIMKFGFNLFKDTLLKTSEQGAQSSIYTAVEKNIEKYNGEHFDDCKKVKCYGKAKNVELARKLWEKTESIVKLTPEENPF